MRKSLDTSFHNNNQYAPYLGTIMYDILPIFHSTSAKLHLVYKYACINTYDFILYNNSSYSITIYEDKKLLIHKQILQDCLS